MTGDKVDRKITQPAAEKAQAAAPSWRVIAVVVFAFAVCVAGAAWVLVSQHSQISALQSQLQASDEGWRSVSEQVKSLGQTPVAQPPAAGTPGATGAAGAAGATGATGPVGPKGDKGDTGAAGPSGDPGTPGAAGTDGVDGTDGQDGAAGVPGPQGQQGEAGPAGPQGEQGPPGPTCPDGYTAQSRLQPNGETWWICVADETTTPTETP